MKKAIAIFCGLSIFVSLKAQNLVPNGNFEQFIGCPTNVGQIDSCKFWKHPANLMSGADYFNRCSILNNYYVGVPKNGGGFQETHSGNGYCGLITYYPLMTNYREYIEVPLISRLESDTCYHVLMHVNLANTRRLSSKNIGAYFSDTLITGINNYYPLPFTPQFNNTTSALPDTLNWTLVEGEFIAGGDERYMIIGNFNNDSLTNAIWINNAGWLSQVYLYIDDVSVYKCKTPIYSANAGVDTTICLGDSVVLEMQHYNNYQYRWYTMNGVLINTNNSLIVSPDTTTSYILKVTDFKYDVTVDTITVIVDDCSNPDTTTSIETLSIVRPQVYISNVFSPNNDGLNDMFEVKGKEIESLHLLIYNLWGNLIFESNDISRGWDGMQNGKKCEAGVYVYRVEIRFNNGQEMNRNGTLTLVR